MSRVTSQCAPCNAIRDGLMRYKVQKGNEEEEEEEQSYDFCCF